MGATAEFRVIEASTAPQDSLSPDACAPKVALDKLEVLWIQVTGTLCNIQCSHCFISCGPANRDLEVMTREQIRGYLDEARALGVKEYYYTGGEPFIHREMVEILEETLAQGPATVLTNAMLLTEKIVGRLREAHANSDYELTFRVSLDGFDAQSNDRIRGPGSFEKALAGVACLARAGFTPIITATRTWECGEEERIVGGFTKMLEDVGVDEVRLKILPNLHIGREAKRSRGYRDEERVTEEMMVGYETKNLICASARIATAHGVRVCPILVGADDATMGQTLKESLGPYPLRHRACHTCYVNGAICSNATGTAKAQPT